MSKSLKKLYAKQDKISNNRGVRTNKWFSCGHTSKSVLTNKWSGTSQYDPIITVEYFFIKIENLPEALQNMVIKQSKMEKNLYWFTYETTDTAKFLSCLCTAMTINYDDKISEMSFIEVSGLPILIFLEKLYDWSKEHPENPPLCDIYYWTTGPDGLTVEFATKLLGLRLLTRREVFLNYYADLSCDRFEPKICLSFDSFLTNSFVRDECQRIALITYKNNWSKYDSKFRRCYRKLYSWIKNVFKRTSKCH